MQTFRLRLALVLALLSLPLVAHGQTTTACDPGTAPLFVLPPTAAGAEYAFPADTAVHAQTGMYRVRLYDADAAIIAPALSVIDVPRTSVTFLGTSPTSRLGCYALPVVPLSSIPPGKRLTLTVQAVGAVAELSALESERGDPFGARLPAVGAPKVILP